MSLLSFRSVHGAVRVGVKVSQLRRGQEEKYTVR